MSGLPPIATQKATGRDVGFVPIADISSPIRSPRRRRRVTRAARLAERLGGHEIDGEIVFGRSLYGQIGRLFALENAIDIARGTAELVGIVDAIRRQSALGREIAERTNRWKPMLDREIGDR